MDTTSAGGSASLPNPVPFGPSADTVREIPPLLAANPGPAPKPAPAEDDDDIIELAADPNDPENSSLLEALGRGPDSVIRRESFGPGSQVNLLSHLRPTNGTSGKLPSTDRLPAPPPAIHDDDEDSLTLHDLNDDDDSSAVDLGSRPVVDLPYPLGVDSSTGSSVVNTAYSRPAANAKSEDSAAVNLLAGNGDADDSEFNLHRHPGASSMMSGLRDQMGSALSLTSPAARNGGFLPWLGGGAIGAAAATVLFAVVYFAALAPSSAALPIVTQPNSALNARATSELEAATRKHDDLLSKLNAAGINPDRLADFAASREKARDALAKLGAATAELDALKAAQSKQQDALLAARRDLETLAPLADFLKAANVDAASLPSELKRSSESRRASEKAAQDALARAATLEAQVKESRAAVQEAEARIAAAKVDEQASRKELAQFQQNLNRRLAEANLVAGGAGGDELLAGVDKALARRTEVAVRSDPSQSDRLFSAGVRAYRERDYRQAEQSLAQAVQTQGRDARIAYLLGIVRSHLGRTDAAHMEFRTGAALEQQYAPGPHDVDEFLARIPSADRALVNSHRP